MMTDKDTAYCGWGSMGSVVAFLPSILLSLLVPISREVVIGIWFATYFAGFWLIWKAFEETDDDEV